MTKFSRRQLAQAFVTLSEAFSWQDLAPAAARLLTASRRQREAGFFAEEVAKAWQTQKGEVFARVLTVRALTAPARQQVAAYVKSQTGLAAVQMEEQTAPEVLGGAVIQTPTHTYDLSARRFLDELTHV